MPLIIWNVELRHYVPIPYRNKLRITYTPIGVILPSPTHQKRPSSRMVVFLYAGYFASFSVSFLRISTRLILPLMVLGSSSTNSTILGYL